VNITTEYPSKDITNFELHSAQVTAKSFSGFSATPILLALGFSCSVGLAVCKAQKGTTSPFSNATTGFTMYRRKNASLVKLQGPSYIG